jgi:hypothetical protein
VGGVKIEPRGLADFIPADRQLWPPLKRSAGFGDNGPVNAAGIEQVKEEGRYHATVGGFATDFRVFGPCHAGFDDAAEGSAPYCLSFGFLFQFVNFRTNAIAQTTFNAFFHVFIPGFAVIVQLQGSVIDGGTEGDAAAAPVAQTRFLDFLNQVEKSFHKSSYAHERCRQQAALRSDTMVLGPKALMVSVNRVTSSANRGASADDTHSMANRPGSMPDSSRTIRMAADRASAFSLPSR